ncbi:hypothetical protein GCM10010261_66220 [Streptomyces pilosus]|nr:hypothetical protein GCM10010261_66220 [Streptomyces pilosus]
MPELREIGGQEPVGDRLTVDEYSVVVEYDEVVAHTPTLNAESPVPKGTGLSQQLFGGVLLSHRVPPAVPSAL